MTNAYDKDKIIASLQLMRRAGEATVYTSAPRTLPPLDPPDQSRLERIRARVAIRAGYIRDGLPFSYVNAADNLVGFDIEMAHTLARDLEVALELVPVEPGKMADQYHVGHRDHATAGSTDGVLNPHLRCV